jgi:hypothetical protein
MGIHARRIVFVRMHDLVPLLGLLKHHQQDFFMVGFAHLVKYKLNAAVVAEIQSVEHSTEDKSNRVDPMRVNPEHRLG